MLKMDQQANVIECSHTLFPPEKKIVDATGGVLVTPVGDLDEEPFDFVVCGGKDPIGSNAPKSKCTTLTEERYSGGFLNIQRVGSASLIVDNGITMWVTGGSMQPSSPFALADTEFVAVSSTPRNISNHNNYGTFPTNGAGPQLPIGLSHHCLEHLTPDVTILLGGIGIEDGLSIFFTKPDCLSFYIFRRSFAVRLVH